MLLTSNVLLDCSIKTFTKLLKPALRLNYDFIVLKKTKKPATNYPNQMLH